MTCDQFEPWIAAYQDEALDEPRRVLVTEHLAVCEACRAVRAALARLDDALRTELNYVDAPETLHGRVMCALPEEEPAPAPKRGGAAPRGWLAFGLAPAGALAAWLLLTSTPTPLVAPLFSPPSDAHRSTTAFPLLSIPSGSTASDGAKAAGHSSSPKGNSGKRESLRKAKERPRPGAGPGALPGSDAHSEAMQRLRRLRPRRSSELTVAAPPPMAFPGAGGGESAEREAQPITVVDFVLPLVSPSPPETGMAAGGTAGTSVKEAVYEF